MSGLRFTLVTPVLNGEAFIGSTLESVARQSHPHWRYLIMDGGSTDGTLRIAKEFAEGDERVSLVSATDDGMYDAVFRGFDLDDGEVCGWINADDLLFPWTLSVVGDAIDAGHRWVTGCDAFWDDQGRLMHVDVPPLYPQSLIRRGWFSGKGLGWIQQEGTFFTRELLELLTVEQKEEIRGMKLAGDFGLWKAFAEHTPLEVLSTVTGGFRMHGSNMSRLALAGYYEEIRQLGGRSAPRLIRSVYRLIAGIGGGLRQRRAHAAFMSSRMSDGRDT